MRNWTAQEIAEIGLRLRQARIASGYDKAADAVKKFGWNYSRYMNYENGQRAIPPKQAALFMTAYNISIDYLYFGHSEELNQSQHLNDRILTNAHRIPCISLRNKADIELIAIGHKPVSAKTMPLSENTDLFDQTIFVSVCDDSMSNSKNSTSFERGDHVLIEIGAVPKSSDYVLALIPEEAVAVLRLYQTSDLLSDSDISFELIPLNDDYPIYTGSNPNLIIGVCRQLHRVCQL